MTPPQRIWIGHAPAGVWSSGPVVITDESTLAEWRDQLLYRIEGPYVLAEVYSELLTALTYDARRNGLPRRSWQALSKLPASVANVTHEPPTSG